MRGVPTRNGLIPCLLLLSGFSALLFQTAWMRDYRLIFGATTAASGVVLGVFMAGLGVGNALLGGFVERRNRPLFWYGVFELLIGGLVAISPLLMDALHGIYIRTGGQAVLGPWGATALRLLLSILVMGGPAILMGGTLPAAVRSATSQGDRRRTQAAVVYAANTLGSVAGVLATTFVLLERWGTRSTLWFGCLINLAIGSLAIAVGRSDSTPDSELESPRVEQPAPLAFGWSPSQRGLLACSALFGFAFFLMEIVWFRMLSPLLGGTTFTFGVILAVVLLGIGLGSSLYAVAARALRPTWGLLAATAGLEALFLIWPYVRGDALALATAIDMVRDGGTFGGLVSVWLKTSLSIVFAASLCSGFQFPLMVALMGEARDGISRQLGWLFAANTLGAIAGSLAGGLGLLPLLTAPGCWRLVVVLLAGISLVIVLAELVARRWRALVGVVIPCCALLGTFAAGPTAVWRHSGIGARRIALPARGANARRMWEHTLRRGILLEAEGVEASLAIHGADGLSFVVNGKSDGHAVVDIGTQIGLGLVGALSHPAPRDCLVVGLGTGETAGWLADLEGVERVTVVELEPKVDEIARRCGPINRNAMENPRVVRLYNDARETLMTRTEPLDLVLSEPSNPYRVGIATLYTQEFYQAVRGRLRPDGVFCQWLQGYEIDDATIDIVLATLRSVFADVQIWRTEIPDLVFVCSNAPVRYDAERLRTRLEHPVLREGVGRAWRTSTLEGVFARYLASSEFVDRRLAARQPPLNTDDRTILEYRLAKTLGDKHGLPLETLARAALDERADLPEGLVGLGDVAEERLAMYYNQRMPLLEPDPQSFDPARRNRAEALSLAIQGTDQGALEAWRRQGEPPRTYAARILIGLPAAKVGDPLLSEILTSLDRDSPIDSEILRAIAAIRAAETRKGLNLARSAIDRLQEAPWGHPLLIRKLLDLTADLASGLDDAGRREVFESLAKPLSCSLAEDRRRLIRYVYGELLGPEALIEALADLEPDVPWTEEILKSRRDAYRSAHHPLSRRVDEEYRQFRNQARREGGG